MNTLERNNSSFERDPGGYFFSQKVSGLSLVIKPFHLTTDLHALQYAFQKNDIHGLLVRWLDFFSEYEFSIAYKLGASNRAADFLPLKSTPNAPLMKDAIIGNLHLLCSIDQRDLEPHFLPLQRYLTFKGLDEIDQDFKNSVKNGKRIISFGRINGPKIVVQRKYCANSREVS